MAFLAKTCLSQESNAQPALKLDTVQVMQEETYALVCEQLETKLMLPAGELIKHRGHLLPMEFSFPQQREMKLLIHTTRGFPSLAG